MSQVDRLPLEEMNDVDWNSLTEVQAAGFGLSLGMFNDAHEERDKVMHELMARAAALTSCAFVGIVLLVSSASTRSTLIAILGTLLMGMLGTYIRYRRSNKQLKIASDELKGELVILKG